MVAIEKQKVVTRANAQVKKFYYVNLLTKSYNYYAYKTFVLILN